VLIDRSQSTAEANKNMGKVKGLEGLRVDLTQFLNHLSPEVAAL